ncbi:metalloprotease [Coprinopsis cinerea okayama7|uniref:Metalloprotease n=1 Tax=Coprinopsis cinerea (strain Okayama-7 / 130 / ATCC MYA-4618 / FGSC 9003) TaxID=240176 RepID=A8NK16_COPC7|nr:metalloprotease [Coprinopsis cinerea okayama7\|eukprot:XP_001834511.2 metalloprotease [Coprinopsis cinerea okayama7\
MLFKPCLAFAVFLATSTWHLFANALAVRQTEVSERCGNDHIDAATKAHMEADFKSRRVPPPSDVSSVSRAGPINVFWHVVSNDETPEGGNVPDSAIDEQMDVLNTAYQGTGLQFQLINVSRTVEPDWSAGALTDTPLSFEMKAALRKGGGADLNIWSCGGLLGYATFPVNLTKEPEKDGVVIRFTTLPGGSSTNFNLGHTLTHEVGHWVGLYHVFEDHSCTGDGDEVDDTPPQSTSTSGCPDTKNSCGAGEEGDLPDSIHNYMDYSHDRCMCEFTNGQVERMHDQLATYRGIELRTGPSVGIRRRTRTLRRLLAPSGHGRLQARQIASQCEGLFP